MARKSRQPQPKQVEAIQHEEATRKNIPTAEYQSVMADDEKSPIQVAYARRDPDLDPQLIWRGKDVADGSDLVVSAPPLYIQEKVHPKVLVDDLMERTGSRQPQQLDLFANFDGLSQEATGTDFYQHDAHWSNRMILGDSLQVMASLAEREGLRGKVQCIYLDPPYGIKFNSNFQWSTTSRDVKDGKVAHITREPEQVKAFRDTWRDGIHSYLTYLRDRLVVARDLLSESGSIFVQIGDENVHRVRALMDEVFGDENHITTIVYRTTGNQKGGTLEPICDYLLFYARNHQSIKYRPLFFAKSQSEDESANPLTGGGLFATQLFEIRYQGRRFSPPTNNSWKTSEAGINRLKAADRLLPKVSSIRYKAKLSDFGYTPQTNIWLDLMGARDKSYVVQTNETVLTRCILMTTDPGDLVLDPTCVRQGTHILIPAPSPAQGRAGVGLAASSRAWSAPLNPPASGGTLNGGTLNGGTLNGGTLNTLNGGGALAGVRSSPIEALQPGDWVIGHDGQFHQILRTIQKPYRGVMVGLQHRLSATVLWVTAEHRVLCQKRNLDYGGNNTWRQIPRQNFGRARTLRKNQTPAEQKLWRSLRREQLGVKFRRQHPMGPYILDFYAHSKGCVIELDGASHDSPDAQAYDADRDRYLRGLGLTVLRFSNNQVFQNVEGVVARIVEQLQGTQPSDRRDREWRRADQLEVGDVVFVGEQQRPVEITQLRRESTEEVVYDLEVEGVHSFVTEVCTVHNCGSGTTAYVAEQWGRRWITIDTSRVALALARARVMGARYPYYLLKDSPAGQQKEAELTRQPVATAPTYGNLRQGFVYERVPHITLKAIANNTEIDVIWEEFQPQVEHALSQLNAALQGHATPFNITTGGRKDQVLKFTAKGTVQLPSGEEAPANALLEWEVPREQPDDWPSTTTKPLAAFWKARIARQQEIDAAIAASADQEYLYDKPYLDKNTVRVAGPFTVESLSPHRVLAVDQDDELIDPIDPKVYPSRSRPDSGGQADFASIILETLRISGVQQAHKADKIDFTSLVGWPGDYICAEGRYLEGENETEKRAGIFIGPEFGTVSRADLVAATREASDAGFDVLIACAFNYDAHSAEFTKLGRIPILKARMNADLHMADTLKNTGSGNLFVIFGEPDIDIHEPAEGQLQVEIRGVDVFHPQSGEIRASNTDEIACWFIDTDYNEESFFVRHAYFLGASDPYKSLKTTLKAEIDAEAWASLYGSVSRPFEKPKSGRIAVKVINHLGDEVMKVFGVG